MVKRLVDISLVALGVVLMGFALLSAKSSLARWSIIPVAVIAIALGARRLRMESTPTVMVVAGCAATILAVVANFGAMNPVWANILGAVILLVMGVILVAPGVRHRLKE